MMRLLTSANDAILVILTFICFSWNLIPICVATIFAFGEWKLMANIFSLPMIATNIRCISNVGLEALRILFYSY